MTNHITLTEERIRRGTRLARELQTESLYQMALAIAIIDTATDEQMEFIEKLIKTTRQRRGLLIPAPKTN